MYNRLMSHRNTLKAMHAAPQQCGLTQLISQMNECMNEY